MCSKYLDKSWESHETKSMFFNTRWTSHAGVYFVDRRGCESIIWRRYWAHKALEGVCCWPHDCEGDCLLWVSATARCHNTTSQCVSLGRKKTKFTWHKIKKASNLTIVRQRPFVEYVTRFLKKDFKCMELNCK